MQIRLARKHDYEQLLALLRQLNPKDPEPSKLQQDVFDEIIGSKRFDLIVAEKKGKLLGTGYVNIIPNITAGGRPYAVIENVVTDSMHRNKGVGKSILNRALEMAWEQNCYKAMLMSGRTDESVHAFYESCGFDPDEKQAYIRRTPF